VPQIMDSQFGMPHPILLYDGVCGLCNRLVRFILRRDRNDTFRFASLQSALAGRILARHSADMIDLGTIYVIIHCELPDEFLLARSEAILFVLKQLGGVWSAAASVLQILPGAVRDAAYSVVAQNRYRIFGRSEVCMQPPEQDRARFLDV
jgi:predicted DCC family thiol-disulfide oxidoreductase YuxK